MLHRSGMCERSLRGDFHQGRPTKLHCRGEGGRRAGTVHRLFHEVRSLHDLILISCLALLNAGGKNLLGLNVRDGDSRAADFTTEDHCPMSDDTNENLRGLWIVQAEIGRRRLALRWNRPTGQRGQERQEARTDEKTESYHLTLVPGSTSSRIVASPRTSLSPAASTIPCDSMPMSLAGFRLATTMMVLPTSDAGSYFFPMPATICRCSLPRETWSLSSFSDLGTRSALSTLAVLSWLFLIFLHGDLLRSGLRRRLACRSLRSSRCRRGSGGRGWSCRGWSCRGFSRCIAHGPSFRF